MVSRLVSHILLSAWFAMVSDVRFWGGTLAHWVTHSMGIPKHQLLVSAWVECKLKIAGSTVNLSMK